MKTLNFLFKTQTRLSSFENIKISQSKYHLLSTQHKNVDSDVQWKKPKSHQYENHERMNQPFYSGIYWGGKTHIQIAYIYDSILWGYCLIQWILWSIELIPSVFSIWKMEQVSKTTVIFCHCICAKCLHALIHVKKKKKENDGEWKKKWFFLYVYKYTCRSSTSMRRSLPACVGDEMSQTISQIVIRTSIHLLKCHKTHFFFFFNFFFCFQIRWADNLHLLPNVIVCQWQRLDNQMRGK